MSWELLWKQLTVGTQNSSPALYFIYLFLYLFYRLGDHKGFVWTEGSQLEYMKITDWETEAQGLPPPPQYCMGAMGHRESQCQSPG